MKAEAAAPLLRVRDLNVALPQGADRRFAVEGAGFELSGGEIMCVVGESGSGKSVLSGAIMGAAPAGLRVVSGSILFRGEDIVGMSEARLRKLRGNQIAMVFQEPMAALNPAVKVGAQIEEVLSLHSRLASRERRVRVTNLLCDMRLPDARRIAASYPHQLSGGQCQRVVIAMALAMRPALLIADEPTSALDVTTQAQVLKLMRELRDEHGHAVLFITHDFGVVAEIADRVAVMQAGRIVEIGDVRAVLDTPRHAYTQQLIAAVPRAEPRVACATKPDVEPALDISHLAKSYRVGGQKVVALKDASFALDKGRTLGIVGESGSGKSTLARVAIRLTPADPVRFASVASISRSLPARRSAGRGARCR